MKCMYGDNVYSVRGCNIRLHKSGNTVVYVSWVTFRRYILYNYGKFEFVAISNNYI